ncbi:MAG: hypothetical protein SGI73_22770, partial [Chloroflexota bacterium]|nr:hypothetical protein [Chloroflexota bacterium]
MSLRLGKCQPPTRSGWRSMVSMGATGTAVVCSEPGTRQPPAERVPDELGVLDGSSVRQPPSVGLRQAGAAL